MMLPSGVSGEPQRLEKNEHGGSILRQYSRCVALLVGDDYTSEFVQWYAGCQWKPDDYRYLAMKALTIAGSDRRSRPLLHRALASDTTVVMIAIETFGEQRDHAALPAIEQALNRLPDDADWLAMSLVSFATDEADRLAKKYLSEAYRPMYEESRQPR